MKRIIKLSLTAVVAVFIFAGCAKRGPGDDSYTIEFRHSGCANDNGGVQPATKSGDYGKGELRLVATNEGLAVVIYNASFNCSIQKVGLVCDVKTGNRRIEYSVHPTNDDYSANCICRVEKTSSTIQGLAVGQGYDFILYLDYVPFSFNFTYQTNLDVTFDIEEHLVYY